jgi:hypothetical protein
MKFLMQICWGSQLYLCWPTFFMSKNVTSVLCIYWHNEMVQKRFLFSTSYRQNNNCCILANSRLSTGRLLTVTNGEWGMGNGWRVLLGEVNQSILPHIKIGPAATWIPPNSQFPPIHQWTVAVRFGSEYVIHSFIHQSFSDRRGTKSPQKECKEKKTNMDLERIHVKICWGWKVAESKIG